MAMWLKFPSRSVQSYITYTHLVKTVLPTKSQHGSSFGNQKKSLELESVLNDACGAFEFSKLEDVLECSQSEEIIRRMHLTAIFVIRNYFGKPSCHGVPQTELISYLRDFLPLTSKERHDNLMIAEGIEKPLLVLRLRIIEVDELNENTVVENSMLFCRLWIQSDPKSVFSTALVENTSPVWNEDFDFHCCEPTTDEIFIELCVEYNEEAFASKKSKERKSLRKLSSSIYGANHYFETVASCMIRIQDIHFVGVDDWMRLSFNSDKNVGKCLHIKAKFGIVPLESKKIALQRHLLLLKTCIEKSVTPMRRDRALSMWRDVLGGPALTLVFFHGVLSGLSACEDIICRFVVIVHSNTQYLFSFKLIFELLEEITEHLSVCSTQNVEDPLRMTYQKSVKEFHDKCFTFIASLHSALKLRSDTPMVQQLEYVLRCIYLCENLIQIDCSPLMTLKSEADAWAESKALRMKDAKPDDRATYLIGIIESILSFHTAANQALKKVSDISYTKMTCESLDDALANAFQLHVLEFGKSYLESDRDAQVSQERGMKLFAKMKEFVSFLTELAERSYSSLRISKFRDWFGPAIILDWFETNAEIAMQSIKIAIASDDLSIEEDKEEKTSSSLEETKCILTQKLVDLWELISIPRSTRCDIIYSEQFYQCCMMYASRMIQYVTRQDLFHAFHEKGSQKVCIAANNLWCLAPFADETISRTVGKIPFQCKDIKENFQSYGAEICKAICDLAMVDIQHHLERIIKAEEKDRNRYVEKYRALMENFFWKEMFSHMVFDVFVLFHTLLWEQTLVIVQAGKPKGSKERLEEAESDETGVYISLLRIMEVTETLCESYLEGEVAGRLWTEECRRLKALFEFKIPEN